MRLKNLFFADTNIAHGDVGILLLRVAFGATLFLNHGWEKLTRFQHMAQFLQMDPLHIGVYPSLAFATLSDGICTLLVMLGLCTRAATAVILINLIVVFIVMQDAFGVMGNHVTMRALPPPPRGHTELVVLFLAAFFSLMITGPGRHSLDRLLQRRGAGASS